MFYNSIRCLKFAGVLVFAWIAIGCSSAPVPIPVTGDMRQFVTSQYESIVGERISPHDTAIIRQPSSVDATYSVSEHFTHLHAYGQIDIHNDRGSAFTGWYDLKWYQHGDARLNDLDTPWTLMQSVVATR
jgi:hypothetical protein